MSGELPFAVRNRQREIKVDAIRLRRFLERAAEGVAPADASATLVLVGDRRIHALNREFRGYDKPTDVLSFPCRPDDTEGESYLGDIVISVETARRQAVAHRVGLVRELQVLALHGLLHLLGYDHETDHGEMRRLEYRLRRRLGITRTRGWRA